MQYNIDSYEGARYYMKQHRDLQPRNRLEYHRYHLAMIALEYYIENVLEKEPEIKSVTMHKSDQIETGHVKIVDNWIEKEES